MDKIFYLPSLSLFLIIAVFFILSIISDKLYKLFSFFCAIFLFLLSLVLWVNFNKNTINFQFLLFIPWSSIWNVHLIFGIDGISIFFILLTTIIFPFIIINAWRIFDSKLLIFCLLLSELLLLLTFTVLDLFLFCLFFESLLIPIFFIILKWGTRERRVKALIYFFIYTLFGSIFLFLSLFILYFELQTINFFAIILNLVDAEKQLVIWFLLFIVFAIKIPIFPFHIWLPEAHVEAPTFGSVLLAALLLKLGSYGILRFLFIFPYAYYFFQPIVIVLCLISIFYSSIIAVRQIDLKRIIAYSSIAHINFALLGFFSGTLAGILGGLFIIISHGLVSSALFILVGILYDRYHTRNIYYYGGLVIIIPIFVFYFFLFIISNFSFPLTSNFIGEILVLLGVGSIGQNFILILIAVTTFFTVLYSLLIYNRVVFGSLKWRTVELFFDITRREFLIIYLLLFLNYFLGIFPYIFLFVQYITIKNLIIFS